MRAVLYPLFFASGAAALVYQVAWQRSLSLVFGGSHLAVSTVLAVFMGGMALGGVLLGKHADGVRRPLRLYGMLEVGIAASALALLGLMRIYPTLYGPIARIAEENPTHLTVVRVLLATAALLVPTTLMGGTLPVLARFVARRVAAVGSQLSFLYTFNTLGAAAGALLTGFVLLKSIGVTGSVLVAVVANLAVGIMAIFLPEHWFERAQPGGRAKRARTAAAPVSTEGVTPLSFRLVLWGIGVSGFCALGYEVLWTRTLSLVVGTSVYGFTIMLVAFLSGIALGSEIFGYVLRRRRPAPGRLVLAFGVLQVAIGASAFAVTVLMRDLPGHALRLQDAFVGVAGTEFLVRQYASAIVAFAYMIVPATLMGAAFPLAGTVHAAHRDRVGHAVGEVLTSNTVGAILGSAISGFVLIRAFGIERSLQLLAAANAGIGLAIAATLSRRRWYMALAGGAAVALLLALALSPNWGRFWDMKRLAIFRNTDREGFLDPQVVARYVESTEILYHFEGVNETINVVRAKGGIQAFGVNGRTEASTAPADVQCQYSLGHVPMLLHPDPRRVFVLGSGAGMTLGATSVHPEVERITLAEIEPGVLPATRTFGEWNHDVLDNPKLHVVFNDGRNYLSTTREKFDVITADPIHPWSGGASYLYTREYFRSVAEHLAPGGIACQWLPIYELQPRDVKTVLRTFAESFPYVAIWLTHYDAEIVASNSPIVIDEAALARRIAATPAIAKDLDAVDMGSAEDFLSYFVLGSAGVRAYAREGLLNTDDNLHLEFSSPEAMGIAELMGTNVAEITSLRESVVPFLAPPAGGDREAQLARWDRNLAAAGLTDPLHVLSLREQTESAEFLRLLTVLEERHPSYARYRWLKKLYQGKLEEQPRLVDAVECPVSLPNGSPGVLRVAAVSRRMGHSRSALYVVDEEAREILAQRYFDGPVHAVEPRIASSTADAMRAAGAACRTAAADAMSRGAPLPARPSATAIIRTTLAGEPSLLER